MFFQDDFETDKGWTMVEEIVGGSACYGKNIGSVTRSTNYPTGSSGTSLLVWANRFTDNNGVKVESPSLMSNHVIAQNKVSDQGMDGKLEYSMRFLIDRKTADQGQVGPEFSLQNTRTNPQNQKIETSTMGIQYVAHPDDPFGTWNVWVEISSGIAAWVSFTTMMQLRLGTGNRLRPGTWYLARLAADFDTNRYNGFILREHRTDGSLQGEVFNDLSAYAIAREDSIQKFGVQNPETGVRITLESENKYNNCGTAGSFQYKMYYDDVLFQTY